MCWFLLSACASASGTLAVSPSDRPTESNGLGWEVQSLHLIVDASVPDQPEILAELELELQGVDASYGPLLFLNSIQETSEFGAFSISDHTVEINLKNAAFANMRFTKIERTRPYQRGDKLRLKIPVAIINPQGLLYYWGKETIVASWINAWYPTPFGGQTEAFWSTMKVNATLNLTLPTGWSAVAGGTRINKTDKQETWEIDPTVAISFTAGPFQTAEYPVGENTFQVVGRSSNIHGQSVRVRTFLESVRRFAEWFGPAPYAYHSIVEMPFSVPGFYGASEQGFILLKTQAFDDPLNSLAVLAHEAAHAWWAISVGVDYEKPGSLWMSEALAQYSAVMAIEEVYGEKTAKEFMLSGKGGFSRNHDASAFRRFVQEGRDHPIGEQPSGNISNYLADSKGAWVYHMLRIHMGEEAFFAALKKIVKTYGGRMVTLEEWQQAFQDQTSRDLAPFFEQWLWRKGAPKLESSLSSSTSIAIRQVQEGKPYVLDLEVELNYEDGTSENLMIELSNDLYTLKTSRPIAIFTLDPNQDLLLLGK